jgi:hypothetical protein
MKKRWLGFAVWLLSAASKDRISPLWDSLHTSFIAT